MGAAAAAVLPSRRPPGRHAKTAAPLPSWTDAESSDFLHWLPVPVTFFEKAFRRLTGLEAQVLGLISRFTYGDSAAGRPEWLSDFPFTKFATLTGASRNGVAIALDRLERAGAIDAERVGRGKRYRVAVQRWHELKELPPETTAEVEDGNEADDNSSETVAKAKDEPCIRMGKHSIALTKIGFCSTCADKIVAAVRSAQEPAAAAPTAPEPPTAEANKKGTIVPIQLVDALHHRETVATENKGRTIVPIQLVVHTEVEQLTDFLATRFAKKLGEKPPIHFVADAVAELRQAGVPLADLFARVDARIKVFRSYGMLPNLVADVINAHVAAQRSAPPPPQAAAPVDSGLTLAEQISSHAAALIPWVESLPGAEKAVEALIYLNQNSRQLADELDRVWEILDAAEIVAAEAAAKVGLKASDRNRINADVQAEVGPRKGRLQPDAFEYELARTRARRFLDACGIPQFALKL